jgi:hypothetical protein
MLPPSHRSVSFDWNSLVEPHLPSSTPFQIRVESYSKNIYQCIVDEGASASILSSLAWKAIGSPKLVSTPSQLLDFDRRPSESLGILPQFPITLGGNTVMVNMIVVNGPLDFNMLLGHDYVYAMNVVVSMLFRVMHFPHNGSIVTIDQLSSDNHHPYSPLDHATPFYVPSIWVDSTPPWVNYVASYPKCSVASEKEILHSCFPSWDMVPKLIMGFSQHLLTLVRNSILIWNMINLLFPYGLLTLQVHMTSSILSFLQMRPSWKSWIQLISQRNM